MLALVEVALAVARPGRVVHRVGDRVRDEEQGDLRVRRAVEGPQRRGRAAGLALARSRAAGRTGATLSISQLEPVLGDAVAASARFSRYWRQEE